MLLLKRIIFWILLFALPSHSFAWGFWAHQRINRLAVFTLPPELLSLYKSHIEYLTEHAVDPDMRRYAVEGEAARHYMDVDHYDTFPFDKVPRSWQEATSKFSEDTLQAFGILPYQLPNRIYELRDAFKAQDLSRIMKLSADIGHYVGDSHVPLHTTENYNGQMTGQKGIHGFWESRLPELYGEQYNFFVGRCYYIEDIYAEAWEAVLESHVALDSVLGFEKQLSQEIASDKKYTYESRNNIVIRTYSRPYSKAYHEMLSGMVERRMRKSIIRVGSYWYTAWKLAGEPDLSELVDKKITTKRPKYKRRLKIIDREASSLGFLRRSDFYKDICCRWKPKHSLLPPELDPTHQLKVAQIRQERAAAIAKQAAARNPWHRFLEWVDTWV